MGSDLPNYYVQDGLQDPVCQDADAQRRHNICGIILLRPHYQTIPVTCQVHACHTVLLRSDSPATCLSSKRYNPLMYIIPFLYFILKSHS